MDLKIKLFIILGIVLIFALIIAYGIYYYNHRPKWVRVYDFLRSCMWQHYMDDDLEYYELLNIKNQLIEEFELAPSVADLCIEHWRDEEWFKTNILEDET